MHGTCIKIKKKSKLKYGSYMGVEKHVTLEIFQPIALGTSSTEQKPS